MLIKTTKTHPYLLHLMSTHYSQPKGFVGRHICYAIVYNDVYYGHIVAGSPTLHLPGRNEYLGSDLNKIINNVFFSVNRVNGKYPIRNFTNEILNCFIEESVKDWLKKYNQEITGFETLVELPRTGEIYLRNGWVVVGQTKGYTCKRTAGIGTDGWTGKRVWDTENLKPKLVLCKTLSTPN